MLLSNFLLVPCLIGWTQAVALPAAAEDTLINRASKKGPFYSSKTAPYYVNPNTIPNVDFDSGESYAGLFPVDTSVPKNKLQHMFAWFYPTQNPAGKDDIVIWLNGGPGCSSLEGFLQENGPISWNYGVLKPVANVFSWNKLAHIVWVEYPIGTGFSDGPITAATNLEASLQFVSFWKNLLTTFPGLQNKNIYITGESYSGVHVPYIGAAMLAENNTKFYNVKGAQMNDPVMPYEDELVFGEAITPAFARYWQSLLALPAAATTKIQLASEKCGLDKYLDSHLTYPPPALPWKPVTTTCNAEESFGTAVQIINPCYNPYHIQDSCPVLYDPLGFPQVVYTPEGGTIYFNIPAVQQAIHVAQENHTWAECQYPVYASDNYYNTTQHQEKLQAVLAATNNVLIGQGVADFVVPENETALAIQHLTWGGKQGFQQKPSDLLVIPTVNNPDTQAGIPHWAGYGVQGTAHTERGLTFSTVYQSGHMIPQYAPAVAFRQLEFLLGRVKSLSSGAPWTVNISTSFVYPY